MKEYDKPIVLEANEEPTPRFFIAFNAIAIVNVAAAINAAFAVAFLNQGITTTNYSTHTTRM